jgi:putative glutamine amidotransferase
VTGPDRGGEAAWLFTWLAIRRAGGNPIRITPRMNRGGVEDLDGLLIGGGADVDLSRLSTRPLTDYLLEDFEQTRLSFRDKLRFLVSLFFLPLILLLRLLLSRKSSFGNDTQRDDLEFTLLAKAVKREMPVMGICRGMQLINIYYGGSLHTEIAGFYEDEPAVSSIFPAKLVDLQRNSQLSEILNRLRVRVNALHHQAVDQLGSGFVAVGQERNGIIQAIENREYPFLLGVQWHPEYLPQKRPQRRLFQALVEACREARDRQQTQQDPAHPRRTAHS